MTSTHLNGHHQKTLDAILAHPVSHNIEWHDVLSLLNNLGTVTERHNGALDVTIKDRTFLLERSKGHDVSADQVRALQKFLSPASASAPASDTAAAGSWVVLIDHHQAKLFAIDRAGDSATAAKVHVPDDDDGARRRLEHKQGNDDHDGGHSSEDAGYYEAICGDLGGAAHIVVLSDGKGRSNAGDHLVDYANRHHAGIARRIVATDRIDISHATDGEVIAAGRLLLDAR